MQGNQQTNRFWPELLVLTTMVATTIIAFIYPYNAERETQDKAIGQNSIRWSDSSSDLPMLADSVPQPAPDNFFEPPQSEVSPTLRKISDFQIRSLPPLQPSNPLGQVHTENAANLHRHNLIQTHLRHRGIGRSTIGSAGLGVPSIPRLMIDETPVTQGPKASPPKRLPTPPEFGETRLTLRRLPSIPPKQKR